MDVDPERNPFGLALDCYASAPQRIDPAPVSASQSAAANQLQGGAP
jgi:hypothetical protein